MMASAAASTASAIEIEEFINGALVTWVESCLPDPTILSGYSALLDGVLLHNVWLQIDPEPQHNPTYIKDRSGTSLCIARTKNFECIVQNLISLFDEEFNQTILVLPDTITLGYQPETKYGLEQMKILLILLLGAAVQCPNKELFIARIKEMDVDTQHAIMEYIKQVTVNNTLVLQKDSFDMLSASAIYNHLVRLTKERESIHRKLVASICIDTDMHLAVCAESSNNGILPLPLSPASNMTISTPSSSSNSENNHMAVELADLKSKIRKLRQELEEKAESQIELREELEYKNTQYEKLRLESQEWYAESKRAVAYRDEVDVLRERADRADRLEIEVQKLRDKVADAEFYKTRVEEIKEDNRLLQETKDMLDDQLQRLRKRTEHAKALESELNHFKQKYNDLILEQHASASKIDELLEQNTQLQLIAKNLHTSHDLSKTSDNEEECNSGDNSLSEQLTNSAQTRAIKLELENKRLLAALDHLKESSLTELTNQIHELEEEKKKLTFKSEQMTENMRRLTERYTELENVFKSTAEVNQKLQDALDNRQKLYDRQSQERELERSKLADLEKHVEALKKDKQSIQTLNASMQRRADDLERLVETKTKEIEEFRQKTIELDEIKEKLYDTNSKLSTFERENGSLLKEVAKLKESLEDKSVLLDKNSAQFEAQTKEINRFVKELEVVEQLQNKYAELEKQNQELVSQRGIDLETIETLRNDLVSGTLATNKVRHNLEKLGLNVDHTNENTELNVETVVEKLVRNPETFKTVREIMLNVTREQQQQHSNGNAKSDICVLCHRKEIFTVEKNIELSQDNVIRNNEPQELSIEHRFMLTPSNRGRSDEVELSRLTEDNAQLKALTSSLQAANEQLQSEKACLSVDVATLGSQITSLNTQHVALQLANSQLAADKDVLLKQINRVEQEHKSLLQDQMTLQRLHEQLSAEYEEQCEDKEQLKGVIRDLRNEGRELRDRIASLEKEIDELIKQNANLKSCTENHAVLRGEHVKLTEDFRSLFATSDRLKSEYKNLQEQYKSVRSEKMKLIQQSAELTDELNLKAEQIKVLEIEYAKVAQRCETLSQLNTNYDTDRKSLMENVSQLLSQYHELLSHSLEDKQHFHEEEKSYEELVHNLCRHKEKLEEKIMEQFKKSQSTVPKKKPFASTLVRRVMSIVPSRNRRSWVDDSRNVQTQCMIGSESGGNDSDNSMEEPLSTVSDTHISQRNIAMRQSLKRETKDKPLWRAETLRNSLHGKELADSSNYRRKSVHGLEPPDVTGSSLTLGTAGSRRTVYLFDENQKIPDSNATQATTISTTSANTISSSSNNSSSTTLGVNVSINTAEPQTPTGNSTPQPSTSSMDAKGDNPAATFLMYNRIDTIIGANATIEPQQNVAAGSSRDKATSSSATGSQQDDKLLRKRTEDKSNSIWYEYGCV